MHVSFQKSQGKLPWLCWPIFEVTAVVRGTRADCWSWVACSFLESALLEPYSTLRSRGEVVLTVPDSVICGGLLFHITRSPVVGGPGLDKSEAE